MNQAGIRVADDEMDTHGLAKLTIMLLKGELAERGLCKTGCKAELRARLEEYLDKEVEREVMIDGAVAQFESE